jgi:8-oxo-dGTP diphosphatase
MSATVSVGIVVKGGSVLMVRRKRREGELRWNFPGGSIEPGEDDAQAVVREVQEETGVTCLPEKRLGQRQHPDSGVEIAYWLCKWLQGDPRVMEKGKADRAQWILADQVEELVTSDLSSAIRQELVRIERKQG